MKTKTMSRQEFEMMIEKYHRAGWIINGYNGYSVFMEAEAIHPQTGARIKLTADMPTHCIYKVGEPNYNIIIKNK